MRYKRRMLLLPIAMLSMPVFADTVLSGDMIQSREQIQQAMSQQNTQDMLLLMEGMRSNVTQFSDLMENHPVMNKENLSEAAEVMQRMSDNILVLSSRMQRGHFDDRSIGMISKNNQHLIDMMQKLQRKLDTTQ